jgi:hypothetical protein
MRRRGKWGYSATVFNIGPRWCQSGQLYTPSAFPPRKGPTVIHGWEADSGFSN